LLSNSLFALRQDHGASFVFPYTRPANINLSRAAIDDKISAEIERARYALSLIL
jgi:hypothetical protein